MRNKQSDFGDGLVYCLILFMSHMCNGQARNITHYHFVMTHSHRDKILADNPTSNYNYGFNKDVKWWFDNIVPIYHDESRALASSIETWANGAADHLYGLCTTTGNKYLDIKLKRLKNLGLGMGHGFSTDSSLATWENFCELDKLTKQCAKMIDEVLGIEVKDAKWE